MMLNTLSKCVPFMQKRLACERPHHKSAKSPQKRGYFSEKKLCCKNW